MDIDRRRLLSASAVAGAAFAPAASRAAPASDKAHAALVAEADRVLTTYIGFGEKASGGEGDTASGAWLERELRGAGYAVQRQPIRVPFFVPAATTLRSGAATATVIAQAQVLTTTPAGVTGPLSIWPGPKAPPGAILLAQLPHRNWSTLTARETRAALAAARQAGAIAVILITTGPSGEALALNTPLTAKLVDRPTAVLAPKDAEPFVRAAYVGQSATLVLTGQVGERDAFNIVARRERPGRPSLILSTPRSGWFSCAGERGPGLAVWLSTAKWAAATLPLDIALVATTGHEYENAGGAQFIEHLAPPAARTKLWAHFGANVAAVGWHEFGKPTPLPSADDARYIVASDDLVAGLGVALAGEPGLEQVLSKDAGAAGELSNIFDAGYRAFGIFGSHRLHHARTDDSRCVSPPLVASLIPRFRTAIAKAVA